VKLSTTSTANTLGNKVTIAGDYAVVGYDWNQAYLFQRSGTDWSKGKSLVPKGGPFLDSCGRAVDMDSDSIILGAPHEDSQGDGAGAAYIFVRAGGGWTHQATLRGRNSIKYSSFGRDVAIDGDTAVVKDAYLLGMDNSFTYVFQRTGTAWSEQKVFSMKSQGGTYTWGASVDVSKDTLALSDLQLSASGTIFVYHRTGNIWKLQQKLTVPANVAEIHTIGGEVSLSGDTLAATWGARNGTFKSLVAGRVYQRWGTTWVETQQLKMKEEGRNLTISTDGEHVILGNEGAAYVYEVFKPDGGPEAGPDAGPDSGKPDSTLPKDLSDGNDLEGASPAQGCSCSQSRPPGNYPWPLLGGLVLLILFSRIDLF